ncbi:MAG: hypothetical protein FJX63_01205 [Alphaproteobacteria bacterium]|nr:hypothetical protein [Alphaproteobacteria bacterium]
MSAVIAFPIERTARTARGERNGPGEIVIFPGVRIERTDFSLSDRLPPARRRRNSPLSTEDSPEQWEG